MENEVVVRVFELENSEEGVSNCCGAMVYEGGICSDCLEGCDISYGEDPDIFEGETL